jgi:hypothetical protein
MTARSPLRLRVGCTRGRERLCHHTTEEECMTTTAQLITGVDFVTVPTHDLDAAVEFYGEKLGCAAPSTYKTATTPSSRPAISR